MRGLHCPSQSISPTRSVANALYVNVIMLGFSGFRDILVHLFISSLIRLLVCLLVRLLVCLLVRPSVCLFVNVATETDFYEILHGCSVSAPNVAINF